MLNNRQQSGRRRGRGGQRQQGGRENGNRIDNRARGNAPQMLEKYKTLARDAQMSGDRVMTEYYLQFADHYFRVVAESRARFEETRRPRDDWQGDEGYEGDDQAMAEGVEGEDGSDDERPQQQAPRREYRERNERAERPERNDRNRERYANDRNGRFNGNRSEEPRDDRDEERVEPGRIDVAVLPPAFASDGPMPSIDLGDEAPADEAPAPRRRGRPRKAAPEASAES